MAFVTPGTHYAVVGLLTNNHPPGSLFDNTYRARSGIDQFPNTMIINTLKHSDARFYFYFHRAYLGYAGKMASCKSFNPINPGSDKRIGLDKASSFS